MKRTGIRRNTGRPADPSTTMWRLDPGGGTYAERRRELRRVDPDPSGNRAQRRAAARLGITAHAREPRKPGMAAYTPPGTGTETSAHMSANRLERP